jgi:hypothetical protein
MTDIANIFFIEPLPASKFLPNWYKNTKLFVNNDKDPRIHEKNNSSSNMTLKGCTPFLDAMSAGYMISLASDIEIYKDQNKALQIKWRTEHTLVESHHDEQTYSIPRSNNVTYEILKWIFDWKIETPKGYSCLYMHPLNRFELPFRTFSGIVDTDMYPDSVHFPFQLFDFEEDFIIIERDTPICQIFPFKREKWFRFKNKPVPNAKLIGGYKILSKIQRSYKNQFWSKKEYN